MRETKKELKEQVKKAQSRTDRMYDDYKRVYDELSQLKASLEPPRDWTITIKGSPDDYAQVVNAHRAVHQYGHYTFYVDQADHVDIVADYREEFVVGVHGPVMVVPERSYVDGGW